MRRSYILQTATIAAVTFWLAATNAPLRGDWSDNFNGGLQQVWQFGDPSNRPGFTAGAVNGRLVITSSNTPAAGGSSTGFGVVVTESFTDVRMTGIINPDNNININDTVGLLFRGNLLNQSFYMAEINYSAGQLIIYRNGGPSNGNLVTEPIPNLAFADSLYLEVEAIGDLLQASVYDMPGGMLRASTSVTDNALTSGLSGVLVDENFAGLPMLGVWDDLTAMAIAPVVDQPDLNGDGIVDAADYTVWRDSLGAVGLAPFAQGDANGDGSVTVEDYAIWRSSFGQTAASVAVATPTPEPGTALLAIGAAALLACWQRRQI
jgi:hypothetical protein